MSNATATSNGFKYGDFINGRMVEAYLVKVSEILTVGNQKVVGGEWVVGRYRSVEEAQRGLENELSNPNSPSQQIGYSMEGYEVKLAWRPSGTTVFFVVG